MFENLLEKIAGSIISDLVKKFINKQQASKKIQKQIGYIPPKPAVFFGRKRSPKKIRRKLNNNLLLLVNGEGGIGKTTLAAKYYYRYKKNILI